MNEGQVPKSRWVLFWTIAIGGATFDLVSKALVFEWVGPPGSPPRSLIPPVLDLRTSFNQGALWGFGKSVPHSSLIFAALSIVAIVAICYWLFVKKAASDWRLTAALALIVAGALGNCYDRLVHGHVRDFVHFHVDAINFDFAIFNFADNMLVAGAACLIVLAMRADLQEPAPAASSGEDGYRDEPLSSSSTRSDANSSA